jgi:hypothetical protein
MCRLFTLAADSRLKNEMEKIQKQLWSSFFKIDRAGFKRCLEPTMQCQRSAIKAHSIQNSKALGLLVSDGHVIGPTRRVETEKGLLVGFGKIGRNEATTFTGLCAEHDKSIFVPIDTKELSITDAEQLFLLAYRAVIQRLHTTMQGAVKVQSVYLKRVELGLSPTDQASVDAMMALQRMIISWKTFRYRINFDQSYFERSFDLLTHDVFVLEHQKPTLAVCNLFSLNKIQTDDGDVIRVILNIIPRSNHETVVVFSYTNRDAKTARDSLGRVLNSDGEYQRYEISRLILKHCENFVISPVYFQSWTNRKRDIIRDCFAQTILEKDLEFEDADLMLF